MTEENKTFHEMGVDGDIADALAAKGITHPFPIQALTLPMALKGADVIGQARTGTGKTLGFGLPLLQRIDTSEKKTQALVVVPTRELCIQVANDLEVGAARGVTSIAVYGGVPIEPQTEALVAGVHVVVGTPGRLLDHLNRGNLDLSNVTEMVLDEADEMLDMGFLPDVERLIEATPQEGRHTMLFSATMPATIVSLARRYMQNPTFMRADSEESATVDTVEQHFFLVHRMDKPRILARILQSPERGGVYVFTRTKHMADRLVEELDGLGVPAIAIHGDLRQAQREKNLDKFRDGRADVLVATEVAARGLDVENVTHVVNYDCPDDEKMYLHRIGRTARAGAKGVAITFAEHNEVERLKMIRKAVGSEHEVQEVFSTSDLLQELFDLPDETPWAHLSRKGKSRSSGSSSEKSSDRGDRGRGSSKRSGGDADRRPSKDARESSDKSSEKSPAKSSRKAAEKSTGRTSEKDTGERSSGRGSGRSRSSSDDGSSTRTRTRTRARSTEDTGASGSRAAKEDATETSTGTSSSSGRTRARARKPDTSDSGSRDSGSSRSRERSGEERSGGEDRSRSGSSRSGSSRGDSSRNESSRGGSSRGGSRQGGSGQRGSGSSRRSSSGERQREERGPGEEPTRRGQDARGDGTPQFARRVKVEHLP